MISTLPPIFVYILVSGFLSLLALVLFLNIFGLPANWLMLGLIGIWKYIYPDTENMDWIFFTILIALAIIGEVLEFFLQVIKARKYGSTSSGIFAGMIGAIIGAIVLSPLFFGLGALIGALLGAWIGCYIMELCKGRTNKEARSAAFGTMVGRFLGTVCKCGIGGVILAVTAQYIWPEFVDPSAEYTQILLNMFV